MKILEVIWTIKEIENQYLAEMLLKVELSLLA